MHDERLGSHPGEALDREAVGVSELVEARHEGARTTLGLKAEQTHDVGPLERLVEIAGDRHGPGGDVVGEQRARRRDAHVGAEGYVRAHVTARDAAMAKVAHDKDAQALEQLAAGLWTGGACAARRGSGEQ